MKARHSWEGTSFLVLLIGGVFGAAIGLGLSALAGCVLYSVFTLFAPAAWCVLTYTQAAGIGIGLALLRAVFR